MGPVLTEQMAVFSGVPESAESVRAFVDRNVDDPTSESAWYLRLIATELFSNAIRHTRSGQAGGYVRIKINTFHFGVKIDVFDQGAARSMPSVVEADEDALSGRGLSLVNRISLHWGYYHHLDGMAVYAVVPHQLPHWLV